MEETPTTIIRNRLIIISNLVSLIETYSKKQHQFELWEGKEKIEKAYQKGLEAYEKILLHSEESLSEKINELKSFLDSLEKIVEIKRLPIWQTHIKLLATHCSFISNLISNEIMTEL